MLGGLVPRRTKRNLSSSKQFHDSQLITKGPLHLITLCYSWTITNLIALACSSVQLGVIIQRYRVELAYNFTPSKTKTSP